MKGGDSGQVQIQGLGVGSWGSSEMLQSQRGKQRSRKRAGVMPGTLQLQLGAFGASVLILVLGGFSQAESTRAAPVPRTLPPAPVSATLPARPRVPAGSSGCSPVAGRAGRPGDLKRPSALCSLVPGARSGRFRFRPL